MRSNIKTSRVVAFGLIVTLLITLCVGTLYKMQIIEGAAHYDESLNTQVSTQTVTAARGNILDRYGRVLVSNRECYNLVINTTRLFGDDVEDPNALILEMVNIVEAAGIDYTDDLPITDSPPFEYVSNMTALQRSMLEAYLDDHDLAEDTSAVELMSYFRTRYDIDNGYSSEDMRKISSVRYALNVRYSINTNEYIFVEDASIDLISDLMGAVGNIIEVRSSYVREYNTQYAAMFGLGESTGIELPEATGNMANPDNHLNYDVDEWVYGDTLQAGIGQSESLFTPLQLAEYCAALANGGTRYSASILKSVRSFDYSTQLYEKEAEVLNTVDSADYNFAAVQQGMYLLAHDVNSSSSVVYQAFNNYSYNGEYIGVAAKTGTSQLGEGVTNNAIFMCYAPFDDPEIAVAIVVSRGYSGANLTSIAKDVLDAYFSLGDKTSTADSENTLLR